MRLVTAWLAGMVFALGLGISGMTDPSKVIAFLDVGGDWDPSLALVMAGAIGVHVFAARWAARRAAPLLDATFHRPKTHAVEPKLLLGAALFGLGWGIAGYCPGPALVSLAGLERDPIVFVAVMLAAIAATRWARALWTRLRRDRGRPVAAHGG